jgi:hypothetical protein
VTTLAIRAETKTGTVTRLIFKSKFSFDSLNVLTNKKSAKTAAIATEEL